MPELHSEETIEDRSARFARVVWGLLLTWTGAVVLLQWGWGVGLAGAGIILLGAQAVRARVGLKVDGFALALGALFVISGAGSLLRIAIDLFPLVCIAAGITILVSAWTSRARRVSRAPADLHAPPHPRP